MVSIETRDRDAFDHLGIRPKKEIVYTYDPQTLLNTMTEDTVFLMQKITVLHNAQIESAGKPVDQKYLHDVVTLYQNEFAWYMKAIAKPALPELTTVLYGWGGVASIKLDELAEKNGHIETEIAENHPLESFMEDTRFYRILGAGGLVLKIQADLGSERMRYVYRYIIRSYNELSDAGYRIDEQRINSLLQVKPSIT